MVLDKLGVVVSFIDSALKYRRSATVHSSSCSSRIAPTKRITAAGLGKIPHDVRAALDLFVQSLEGVRTVQLPLVFEG